MTVTSLTSQLFLTPVNSLGALAILGGLAVYGRGLAGRSEWGVATGAVAGVVIGLIIAWLGFRPPYAATILAALVLVAGLLIAFIPRLPDSAALVGAVFIGAMAGACGLVPFPATIAGWAGLFLGLVMTAASGIGIAAMLSQSVSWQAVKALGIAIAAYGMYLLFLTT